MKVTQIKNQIILNHYTNNKEKVESSILPAYKHLDYYKNF